MMMSSHEQQLSNAQNLCHSTNSFLVKNGIPKKWMVIIPNMLDSTSSARTRRGGSCLEVII